MNKRAEKHLEMALGGNMNIATLKPLALIEIMTDFAKKEVEAINYTRCCESDSEQLNVSFNVGDKVIFDNKKAVVLWTSVNYLDIELVGTNKILQGVHTSKVLPR